jgi:hypothetical protein
LPIHLAPQVTAFAVVSAKALGDRFKVDLQSFNVRFWRKAVIGQASGGARFQSKPERFDKLLKRI